MYIISKNFNNNAEFLSLHKEIKIFNFSIISNIIHTYKLKCLTRLLTIVII